MTKRSLVVEEQLELTRVWEIAMHYWKAQHHALLRRHGITANQFAVLRAVATAKRQHTPNQQFIASFTGLDKMFVSQVLDSLAKKRLLWRVPAVLDTRQNTVKLGAGGRLLLKNIDLELQLLEEELLKALTGEDCQKLKTLLLKLTTSWRL